MSGDDEAMNRGVLRTDTPDGERVDHLYRVSIKALVQNPSGEVLVVKEAGRQAWDLPGGGVDHDETIYDALKRELHEEASYDGEFEYRIIAVEDPHILEGLNVYQLRLVMRVIPASYSFSAGEDCDEMKFIDPELLKDSDHDVERKVCSYAKLV